MNEAISVSGFSKRYAAFELRVDELHVPQGRVVGLVGGNGAGKTTLIKAMLGMLPGFEGRVCVFGTDLLEAGEQEVARLKQDIGVVLDTCAFPDDFTVAQCASTMRRLYTSWSDDAFAQLAAKLALPHDRKVKELSRGMGMKLSLACALGHMPELLVLDEATAGLDPMARDEVIALIRDFMAQDEGRAVLMSSHITSDLDKIADAIVCLDGGHVVFDVERDAIERAGVALCGEADVEALTREEQRSGEALRVIRESYSARVLVSNRFEFTAKHPRIPVEPVNTEVCMQFMMKGEEL